MTKVAWRTASRIDMQIMKDMHGSTVRDRDEDHDSLRARLKLEVDGVDYSLRGRCEIKGHDDVALN